MTQWSLSPFLVGQLWPVSYLQIVHAWGRGRHLYILLSALSCRIAHYSPTVPLTLIGKDLYSNICELIPKLKTRQGGGKGGGGSGGGSDTSGSGGVSGGGGGTKKKKGKRKWSFNYREHVYWSKHFFFCKPKPSWILQTIVQLLHTIKELNIDKQFILVWLPSETAT